MNLQQSFVVICMYLSVCQSLARSSPCDNSYWVELREEVGANIVSSGNPLVGEVPHAIYTPRPNNLFHVDGHLLMRTSQESDDAEVFDELVFLRGVGEYYEFSWNVIDDNQYATAMNSINESGFNMIRQFVYSGFYDAPGWIYPFTKINGKFALHKYDETYFTKLNQLIEAAEQEDITVLLTLFDFSEDVHYITPTPTPEDGTPTPTPTHTSKPSTDFLGAWNPLCNYYDYNGDPDYSFPESYTYSDISTEFFEIYKVTPTPTPPGSGTPELNFLGKTQRDYVLKVVRETRHHPNVIYEIANEPKCNDAKVATWANQVSQWIKWGAGESCRGCYEAVVSITEADAGDPGTGNPWNPYNQANQGLLSSGWIDIFSRHNCYHGAKTNVSFQTPVPTPDWATTPTSTPLPQPFNADTVKMWQEGAMLYSDFYYWLANSPDYPKAFLVDTDGAHRGSPYNVNPRYRDSDVACQNWANIAQTMGAGFNTKDSIHTSLNYDEVDSTTSVSGNFAVAIGPFWDGSFIDIESIPANDPSSGCDDFWWESANFYTGLPTPLNTPYAELHFDGIDVPLGHSLAGDYFNPDNPPDPLPITPLPSKINYKPKVLWVAYGENSVSTTEDVLLYCSRGNLYGFGRGTELEDEITVYGPEGFTSTPLPSGDQSPFIHKGNLTSYIFRKGTPTPGDHYIAVSTKDSSVTGTAPESHTWPLLGISEDSISWPTPTTQSSTGIPQLLAAQEQQIYGKEVPAIIERLDCYEPLAISQQDLEIDAEIMGAGYNYSNLHTGYFTGVCQLEIILRYEISDTFDPEIDVVPFDYIGIKSMAQQSYTDLTVIDLSGFDYAELLSEEENYLTLSLNSLLLDGNYTTAPWALNIALLKKNGTDDYTVYKNEWPVLNVFVSDSTTKYISAGVVGQEPDGSYSDPFGSVSEAITWIDNKFNGTIDREHPIELIMLPGDHEVTNKNKITLPTFYELTGEPGAVIELPSNESFGSYVELGHGSTLKNLTIECGVKCDHSRAYIDDCIFKLPSGAMPAPTPTPPGDPQSMAAVVVTGHHDLHLRNCLFIDQEVPVFADKESVLSISNCTFAGCKSGLTLSGESISKISNCIFYDISNSTNSATAITTKSEAYAYVENSAFYGNDRNFNELNNSELNTITSTLVTTNPMFVDAANEDFHLIQTTCRNSLISANTSPCVDSGAWNGFISGSTQIDNARDHDQNDMGYHYPSSVDYIFPRFKAEDGTNTDYTTEIAIFNPTEYTQTLSLTCRNMSGTIQDFNGTSDGNVLEVELGSGETWFKVLSDSCSPSDDECMESPCDDGSIEVESDGPLFGQYRIVEDDTSRGKNAWMLPMQRVDLMEDEGDAVSLANDSWTGNFGGGSNSTVTELVLRNLDDGSNTITGTVYNNQGTPVPSESFTESLAVGETEIVMFDGMSMMDYSNMEFYADGPVVGEVIFHCQNHNVTGGNNFSHGEILHPSSNYSDVLTAPYVQLINSGSYYQESYVCLKNPGTTGITAYVDVIDEEGDSIFEGSPTPTPISIPAHGSDCISSYDFPDWGTYSVEIDIADGKKVIGHQEIMSYESSETDFGFAGCQLDHHIESPTRFFVPMCTLKDSPEETTWVALRNNNSASVSIDLEILDLEGNSLDDTTVTLGALEILVFTFGDSPALLDPDTEERFSLVIESTGNLSGWVEQYGINTGGDDQTYDANLLHSW